MLSLLKSDKPVLLFIIPIIIVACWIGSFVPSEPVVFYFDSHPMPLFKFFARFLGATKALSIISSLLLIVLQVMILIRINARYRLIEQSTYLPAAIYAILTASFPGMLRLHPLLFSNTLFLLCIFIYFNLIKERKNLNPFYESGLVIGLSSLFYFNSIFLFPLLLMALSSFRSFYWREWMMAILGVLTIAFLAFTYYFFFDRIPELVSTIQQNAFVHNKFQGIKLFNLIFWGFIVFLFLLAMFTTFTSIAKKISTRKYYGNFIALIFLLTILYFIIPGISVEIFFLAAIPLSYYLSNYLMNMASIPLAEIVFITIITLFILAQTLSI